MTSPVHVWHVELDRPRRAVENLHRSLSPDEHERAARFRFARDRDRYVVGRGTLRTLLARELGIEPADVRFRYGPQGKPSIDGDVHFNVSHSGGVALFALTRRLEIGVDIELAREDFSKDLIAERFFSPVEVGALRALPAALQPRAFLSCWTRKEAFIKATGDGLKMPLDSFDVTLDPRLPAELLRSATSTDGPKRWCLVDLSDPAAGYVAALAVRNPQCTVVRRTWTDDRDPTTQETR